MKQRGILILALALGVLAVILVMIYIRGIEEKHRKEDMVSVLVAAKDIPAGTALKRTLVAKKEIPKQYLNPNAVLPDSLDLILDQVTNIDLRKDQQIAWSNLGVQEMVGLAGIIREGERALTIAVDEVSGVAGLLRPNDHVDIIGCFETPKDLNIRVEDLKAMRGMSGKYTVEMVTLTLLQNVTVLATGDVLGSAEGETLPSAPVASAPVGTAGLPPGMDIPSTAPVPSRLQRKLYRTVTLLVTPLEAQMLVHAASSGRLQLALRNAEDLLTEIQLPKITYTDIVKPEFVEQIQEERTERIIEVIEGRAAKRSRRRR